MSREKFKFTTEYQWDLLRYTVQDNNGERALKKWEDNYFTLIEHQVIAHTLKNYYKKNKNIPGETIFREELIRLLNSKKYERIVDNKEKEEIIRLVKPLYHKVVKDSEVIYRYCKEFKQYTLLKTVLENIDITDFAQYETVSRQIQIAISDEDEKEDIKEGQLLADILSRQVNRQEKPAVIPTPFKQVNRITNAGGYESGSIIVLLDKEKKGKTMSLANVARGYLRMKKKVLVIDLENGRDNWFYRLEQSIMKLTKKEVISGEYDEKINRRFKKYKKLGGEIYVARLPALVTSSLDIQNLIDKLYREIGFKPEILVVDYAAKLAANSRKEDDRGRISEVYLDLSNLAIKNNIEHIWTANHVTREGARLRMRTRYLGEDIANCIDIVRHANAIFGLNRTEEEEETGFLRWELVSQRDGQDSGRAVFNTNPAIQHIAELSISDRKVYDTEIWPKIMENDKNAYKTVTKKDRTNDFSN